MPKYEVTIIRKYVLQGIQARKKELAGPIAISKLDATDVLQRKVIYRRETITNTKRERK